MSGIKGFKGKTANDLLTFFDKKVEDAQAKFERFQKARKESENAIYRQETCQKNGFSDLKAGDKIGVTEPDKQGIYWMATVVGPQSGAYLLKYDYRGKDAESILTNCDNLARLDDKSVDIRKFKNASEAGAAFGTSANSKYEADLGVKMCGSPSLQYIKETGRCIKRK